MAFQGTPTNWIQDANDIMDMWEIDKRLKIDAHSPTYSISIFMLIQVSNTLWLYYKLGSSKDKNKTE